MPRHRTGYNPGFCIAPEQGNPVPERLERLKHWLENELTFSEYTLNPASADASFRRITSYNVCYTKLLRIQFLPTTFEFLFALTTEVPRVNKVTWNTG